MATEIPSPETLQIAKRDIDFEFPPDMRRWHPDGLHVTHFYNALSLFFPEGESFFIDAVRHYRDRVRVMLLTTVTFWAHVFVYHFALIRSEGALTDVRGWWRLFRFLWIKPGGMWRMWRMWLEYFRPDFHPWQHDNHDYVDSWKATYEANGAVPA